jgi:uncharacterized membrane protein HdeD (DUF308 family)
MEFSLSRNWWALIVRGVAAIAFGVLAMVWPAMTLEILVLLFGAYALVDGILAIVAAIAGHGQPQRWWGLFLEGIAGIAAGVITFVWPGITALVLLFLIAFWAIATGILEFITAIHLHRAAPGEWALALGGILSVLFGVILIAAPGAGALAVVWLIGAYAIAFGLILLTLGFQLRSWTRRMRPVSGL